MEHVNLPGSQVDVTVVGAGLAGLVAAHNLLAAGLSVLVLEGRDRVGGRTLNHTLENGAVVELGGQWVGPTQDRVLALAEELSIGLFPTYVEGAHFLAVDGAVKRYAGDDFPLPEDALADVGETQQRLEEMASSVPLDEPWRAANADAWDAQTVEAWLVASAKTETGRGYWRTLVPALFSAEPRRCHCCTSCSTADREAPSTGSSPPAAALRRAVWRAVRSSSRCSSLTGWATSCNLAPRSRPSARITKAWR